jgi:pilus assembly protein Flp/PilA
VTVHESIPRYALHRLRQTARLFAVGFPQLIWLTIPVSLSSRGQHKSLHRVPDRPLKWNFESKSMLSIFRKLMKNEHGAAVIGYVLIASLISMAAIVAMGMVAAANIENTMK